MQELQNPLSTAIFHRKTKRSTSSTYLSGSRRRKESHHTFSSLSASQKSGNSRSCRHFLGFVTHGKAFVVDKSATSEGLIDQVFLFLVWIYPESYTFLHHPCYYTIYFLSIQVFGLFSITCVNSMYMSYIPIAEARGFTTHLIKSPSFMIHLPLRLFTSFCFECR